MERRPVELKLIRLFVLSQNKNRIVESREVEKEELMSTRENACKKCLPNKKIKHGKPTFWNKEEITVILRYLQDDRTCNPTYNNLIISTRTSKSDELDYLMLVKQQQEIQAKINIYQNRRIKELEQERNQLQIQLDKSKEYFSIKRMEKLNPNTKFSWRLLEKESDKLGLAVKKVFDQNYGEVNACHISAFKALYFDTLNYGDKRVGWA